MAVAAPPIEPVRPGPRQGFRWTAATIGYAIDLWHRKYLRTPTALEWERAGEDHPCRGTVNRVFGSWNAAISSAGFRPREQGQSRSNVQRRRCPLTGRLLPNEPE
jgi:hypothetical protein